MPPLLLGAHDLGGQQGVGQQEVSTGGAAWLGAHDEQEVQASN